MQCSVSNCCCGDTSSEFHPPHNGSIYANHAGRNESLTRCNYQILDFAGVLYGPVCTNYLTPNPVYPDSYKPGLIASPTYATDSALGFSGGDVAPMVPGSRFRIFDN